MALLVPAASLVLLVLSSAFLPGRFEPPFGDLSNPLGITGTHDAMIAISSVGWVLAIAGMALGAVSAASRLRWARGDERQQLKLVLTVGAVIAAVSTLDMFTWYFWPHGGLRARMAVIGVSFAAFAVAAGIAILRYRLYDVDVAIERTLVYGTLSLLLAAGYALTTLALGTVLGRGSTWVTAAATLLVALAFRPLRRALQDAVDRRFSRARYEALRRIRASSTSCAPAAPPPSRSSRCSASCWRIRRWSCACSWPRAQPMSTPPVCPCSIRPAIRGCARRCSAAEPRSPSCCIARPAPSAPTRWRRSSRRVDWRSRSRGCGSSCAGTSPRLRPRGRAL